MDPRHATEFPPGFFARDDENDDADFYTFDRFVTHIDDGAIAAVGAVYQELGLVGEGSGPVLDICSSWISHFPTKPERLVITGMNAAELAANEMADEWVVKDLNAEPVLPFDDEAFAAVTCAVSVDYLNRPLDVFAEVVRVLRPGGVFVCTFSNRCFPTKAIRGWLANNDRGRVQIVGRYFDLTDGFASPIGEHRNNGAIGDPLYAVWAYRSS
ncbi:MAG: methyltransferase domain-containing protein [Actinomycetota bacterium]